MDKTTFDKALKSKSFRKTVDGMFKCENEADYYYNYIRAFQKYYLKKTSCRQV